MNQDFNVPRIKNSEAVLVAIIIFCGILLRLAFPLDMEFKLDESYLFQRVMRQLWGTFGDQSSVGINNPPLSVWIFILIGKVFGNENPMQVCLGVRILNSIGLLALYAYGLFKADSSPRFAKILLWTTAFSAVSPSAVLFQKKIWAQSILPFFMAPLWISFFERHRKWAPYLLGFLCAVIPQIHLSGIFFVPLLIVAGSLSKDWKFTKPSKGICFGLFTGSLTLIPWFTTNPLSGLKSQGFTFFGEGLNAWKFLINDLFANGFEFNFGMTAIQSLMTSSFYSFARFFIFISVLAMAIEFFRSLKSDRSFKNLSKYFFESDDDFRSLILIGTIVCIVYPSLLTIAGIPIHRHYFIVMSPFTYIIPSFLLFSGVSRYSSGVIAKNFERLRTTIAFVYAVGLLIISIQILTLIHQTKDFTGSDYGKTFESQLRNP